MRLKIALACLLALTAACSEDGNDAGSGDVLVGESGDFDFIELDNAGITYLCIYRYVDGGYDGGPALWCERQAR